MFYYYHARCCLLSWQLCYVCIHADILLLCSIFQFILSSFLSTTFWINISIDFGSMRLIWMVWVVLLNNFHNKINNKISISVEFQLLQKKHDSPGLCMSEGWVHVSELMYSKYDFQYNEARGWQEDHICFPTYRMFRNICCNIPKFVTLRLIFRSGSYVNFSREHSRQMLLF